ncbi:MAG: hypothetical protein HN341_05340 [Verrucomicrobia bacterium]|jgi:hypothetical protein|nr:hypothetical protein [Verrucomicrobiota bacterium]
MKRVLTILLILSCVVLRVVFAGGEKVLANGGQVEQVFSIPPAPIEAEPTVSLPAAQPTESDPPSPAASLKAIFKKMEALEEALEAGILEKRVYDEKRAALYAQLFPAMRKKAASDSAGKLAALDKALAAEVITREEYDGKRRALSDEASKPWPNDLAVARRMVAVERFASDGALSQGDAGREMAVILREVGLGQAMEAAGDRAQKAQCLSSLRHIDMAKMTLASDADLADGAVVTQEALVQYLEGGWGGRVCPKGGTYAINPIGTRASCSIPDHSWE